MNRRTFTIGISTLLSEACRRRLPESTTAGGHHRSLRGDLVFITRDGCVNTPDMLLNLDDALRGLSLSLDYEVIDLGKLPKDDVRTSYSTPTVLFHNRDLFEMPVPVPPYPEPS